MTKQKLALWTAGFIVVAAVVSYGVLNYVKNRMDERTYKGLDMTMSSLEKLEKMQEQGAQDFDYEVISGSHEGQQKKLSDLKGQVILLNFWASWCEPCIQEFPDLVALATAVPEVKIIAASRDFEKEEALAFISAFPESEGKISFFWDKSGDLTNAYGTEVLPESYIIGKDFKVVKKVSGLEKWDRPEIVGFFKQLVQK